MTRLTTIKAQIPSLLTISTMKLPTKMIRKVSFSALLKNIANILDFMGRLKNEEDQNVVNVADHTEGLKFVLAFISHVIVLNQVHTITDEQLNFLLLNLHYISTILAEQVFPLMTQYEILQNVCGNMRDFHGLVVNGYVEQDIVKYVLPQFPLMAERVGLFLWDDRFKRDSRLFKLANYS
ncbi:hypothetical protein FXO38_28355 [Capsicum annuum]|nr:hypothetical protein FXO38_28355 [Capsicum annuum]KAF3651738.1 hypothetical protein FXO37_17866 [Capsicum annuum]